MLDIRTKLALQRQASDLKKQIKGTGDIRQRLSLQRQLSGIIKQLKGAGPAAVDAVSTSESADAERPDQYEEAKAIDAGANEAATGDNDLPEPTEAQKLAGNYKKGRVVFAGIDIVIENPKGSTRSGTAPDGTTWSTTMRNHYGDLKGTRGADGDPVDVFLGDVLEPELVYVIDQINPENGQFDEHKVMLGFDSIRDAKKAYFLNYERGWRGLGAIKAFELEQFKTWMKAGQKTEPVKYAKGDAPLMDADDTERQPLDVTKYQLLSAIEVKQEVLALESQGYTVPDLVPVLDNWLQVNVANSQYIREQNVA